VNPAAIRDPMRDDCDDDRYYVNHGYLISYSNNKLMRKAIGIQKELSKSPSKRLWYLCRYYIRGRKSDGSYSANSRFPSHFASLSEVGGEPAIKRIAHGQGCRSHYG
jgi:hypothetical protein